MRQFRDRYHAGRRLADELVGMRGENPAVLALPRGGVPVASEVALALGAPLDVIVVRKLGVPVQPELGMGAIGEGGVRVLNVDVIRLAGVTREQVAAVEAREREEVHRRATRYRGERAMYPLVDRSVIIVDDGLATGATARAAVEVVRAHGAARIIVAVPVAPPEVVAEFRTLADDVVALETPTPFAAIGQWYAEFAQTSDDEVTQLLDAAAARTTSREQPGSM